MHALSEGIGLCNLFSAKSCAEIREDDLIELKDVDGAVYALYKEVTKHYWLQEY